MSGGAILLPGQKPVPPASIAVDDLFAVTKNLTVVHEALQRWPGVIQDVENALLRAQQFMADRSGLRTAADQLEGSPAGALLLDRTAQAEQLERVFAAALVAIICLAHGNKAFQPVPGGGQLLYGRMPLGLKAATEGALAEAEASACREMAIHALVPGYDPSARR